MSAPSAPAVSRERPSACARGSSPIIAVLHGARRHAACRLHPPVAGGDRPGTPCVLLGPITIDPAFQSKGIGGALMRRAMEQAKAEGHRLIMLVGDAPYYERFGFKVVAPAAWRCPAGRSRRLLVAELVPGASRASAARCAAASWPPDRRTARGDARAVPNLMRQITTSDASRVPEAGRDDGDGRHPNRDAPSPGGDPAASIRRAGADRAVPCHRDPSRGLARPQAPRPWRSTAQQRRVRRRVFDGS